MNREQYGFTLAELAVVIMILGLILGGLATVLPNQINNARISSTQQSLSNVNDALIGYAMTHSINGHPFLPCPAVNATGTEGPHPGGVCAQKEGWLPWAVLGTPKADAWGNLFRYRVDIGFSDHANGFQLNAQANLQVCQHALTLQPACQALAQAVPAVYFSAGPDGYGAFNNSFSANPAPPGANVDEIENTNGSNVTVTNDAICPPAPIAPTAPCTFVSHPPVNPGGTPVGGGQFGNIVGWLPANLLFSRLVAAGKLP